MNRTTLAMTALVLVAAATTAIGFLATQSAAAQFDTSNTSTQSSTQTGTATGGAGGSGGSGGSASVSQNTVQQAAQSGAFGSSSNTFSITR
jgi:hypothetical protein